MTRISTAERAPEQETPGRVGAGLFDPRQLVSSLPAAVRKLDPRRMIKSPVMFVVEVGAVLTTVLAVIDPSAFAWWIVAWLWFTVLFANLAEAVAEGRGRAQAATLRSTRKETPARRLTGEAEETISSSDLRLGDLVVVEAGEVIPGDGDVVEGVASVDESAITGESAPVIRESGGDRCAVTGGTKVLSDRIVVRITAKPGESFVDRMIAMVEGASRQKTPNEIALNILLASLTIIFLLAVATLQPFSGYSGQLQSMVVLVALLVCLIPTTIGALLSAIGIAGMDRLVQRNVLAMSGRAVEAAGDVNVLLLDKTGTITFGDRQATELLPVGGVTQRDLADAAQLASLADATPEGRSVVVLVKRLYGMRERHTGELPRATFVEFTAQTRMSGVDLADGRQVRKGAAGSVLGWVREHGGRPDLAVDEIVDDVAAAGGTPLVVGETVDGGARVLGVIHLADVVKHGMRERFDELRAMGIRTVMVTGDNQVTAKVIAEQAGVDDFLAEAKPEDKMALIKREQAGGRLVAMTGEWHERRAGACSGRRGGGHEHRHPGGQRGRQHGRPRFEPDQADRDRRDRQAVAHHPGRADDVLDRQRRREVLRDHPRDVRGHLPAARRLEHHAARDTAVGDPLGGRLQRAGDRRPDPAGVARRAIPAPGRGGDVAAQRAGLRPRRPRRAVRRDQAHRPRRLRHSWDRVNHVSISALFRQSLAGLRVLLVLTVVLGLGYPLAVTGVSQLLFDDQANGSTVSRDGEVVGSSLLGQSFDGPEWFHSRPSNAGDGYDSLASGGSNLGPESEDLLALVEERRAAVAEEDDVDPADVAPDALTASGSGLDPHISPRYAEQQVERVARERQLDVAGVRGLVRDHTQERALGVLGGERVNVLELNLALDELG
ncbi:MAG TPA: potassium-transporting ATPase subunit KdpB [Jiangellaceae bacterium]